MIQHAVKLDRQIQQANLCAPAQLDQILQEAELRQQRAHVKSPVDSGELLAKIASELASKKLDAEPIARELGAMAISLAKLMIEKIVGSSEALQTERLSQIIHEALSRPEPVVRVAVNPTNLDAIQAHFREREELREIELKSDAAVVLGECRIELDTNSLVSSMENQLHEIESRLLELIDNA